MLSIQMVILRYLIN